MFRKRFEIEFIGRPRINSVIIGKLENVQEKNLLEKFFITVLKPVGHLKRGNSYAFLFEFWDKFLGN
ncbi:hypothetical protein LEP1GSC193_3497 [Leptospira alstonii serovar Pingchang str. 80-412]|uniref:Uncharacterized protein n=2 Tax=Leptospira alstonii TaxID=28452 RepID=M6CHJ1_9LEPT|nr:hypothetical protein LEP1GSC194_2298 [Leptospira alstonii serovar Sichuan str. 79601]EQA82006.1 hypothetical protein LEP1GSC193_3497 [Leptospira alstonii serovar Pingchang str. 80-412]